MPSLIVAACRTSAQQTVNQYDLYGGSNTVLCGQSGSAPDAIDGVGTAARFWSPMGIDLLPTPAGFDLLVVDSGQANTAGGRLRRIVVATRNVTTIAGNGNYNPIGDTGPALQAGMNSPYGVAVRMRSVYVSEAGSGRIRVVDLDSGMINTFAGGGMPGYVDSQDPLAARFGAPRGITFTGDKSTLLVMDA